MFESDNIKKIYFLGIGGIGMSALARYFLAKGIAIYGYDKTPSALTKVLSDEGMIIHYEDNSALIPTDTNLVIYTPAIPPSLGEYNFLKGSGIPMFKRAQLIGKITEGKKTIAVAGTHGKTSISSLIAHILKQADYPVTALIGGISKNYQSNFITSGKEDLMVVEADEYDRSFLYIHPDVAVISAMDPDHLDIFGDTDAMKRSFNDFAHNIKPNGKLIARDGLAIELKSDIERIYYSTDKTSNFTGINLRYKDGLQLFDLVSDECRRIGIAIQIPGRHNVENTVAAVAACTALGVSMDQIQAGIESFTGVRRRFDIRINQPGRVYIDDYAHHPQELEAFIKAVRQMYPGKKLTGLFQPHLYSRTRDFASGFAQSLDLLDEAWLLDIYPARELPIPGISSQLILNLMMKENKKLVGKDEILKILKEDKPEIFLTMGAGDIDLMVEPITKILES